MTSPKFRLLLMLGVVFLSSSVMARSYYGRNICRVVNEKPICCLGWALDDTNLHCSIPVCTGQCEIVGGRCIKPDTCLCPGGYEAFSCYTGKKRTETQKLCNIKCRNGGTCEKDTCLCPYGFSGTRCEIARCPNDCSRQGSCSPEGKCVCSKGYSGDDCSTEGKEPCYRSISRGLCRFPMENVKTTREVCCNSIGAAWGNPCTVCSPSSCQKGLRYSKFERTCVDINECQEIRGLCGSGSCRNTKGSFQCHCPEGTRYNGKKFQCESEYDVCKRNPRICGQGKCIADGDDFTCSCYNGYTLSKDRKRCVSSFEYLRFDMCRYNRGYLCHNGKCIPQGRSYKCRCNRGYQASQDGRSCEKEVDVCRLYGSSVCANGRCVAMGNTDYRCVCNNGYETSSDQKKCISICDRYGDTVCQNGRCVPRAKSEYECQCDTGFYQTLNRKGCVRESQEQRTVCDYYSLCTNGRCVPSGRSYRCQCDSGYQSSTDGKACERAPRIKKSHICDMYGDYYCPNARCVPVGNSYRCDCHSGYEMNRQGRCQVLRKNTVTKQKTQTPENRRQRTRSKDYCSAYPYLCNNGKCISTRNYFYCQCNPGYTAVDEKRRCRKDEKKPAMLRTGLYDFCQHYRSECQGGSCHNEPTTYWCTCLPNFKWDERRLKCVPHKPRRLVSDEWSAYAEIRQKPISNWRQTNRWRYSACEKMGRDVCGKGYCVDQGSSFECRCDAGYMPARHNKRCVDINECEVKENVCWQGTCINTQGSYSCRCLKGYELSHVNRQPMCVDRNECESGNPCINGFCRNTWGSYKCICNDGYENDASGTQCLERRDGQPKDKEREEMEQPVEPVQKTSVEPMVSDDSGKPSQEENPDPKTVGNCSECTYSCEEQETGGFRCNCPTGLSQLGNSDLCVEPNDVAQYTFEIQMDDADQPADWTKRRVRRSIPDKTGAPHIRARLILNPEVDIDRFTNSLTTKYKNTPFLKIVKLGDTAVSKKGSTNTVVDVFFI